MGIENIVAVDGEQKRLDFAKRMGAEKSVNFKDFQGIDALAQGVKMHSADTQQNVCIPSVQDLLWHMQISTNSSETVEDSVNSDSSSMVEMQRSTTLRPVFKEITL